MKKTLISIIYFLSSIFSIQAQTLYSTTFTGGNDGGGTIIKFIPATNNLTVEKSFGDLARHPQHTNFIQAKDGKLYGMTSHGGSKGNGIIFSYDPVSATYTSLKDFNTYNEGTNPVGSLIEARDGKLYGVTAFGGSTGFYGVIFSFDPSSNTYTKVKDFTEDDDGNPSGSLVEANDGKLYGMTSRVIFSYDPSTSIYTKLHDFDNINGANPQGSLIQARDGKLYGTTSQGGSSGFGVIFSYDPSFDTYTKLKEFDDTHGDNPNGHLTEAPDGKLYGLAAGGGKDGFGFIFSFDPASSTYTGLWDFDNISGRNPFGSLISGIDGKLYGMTAYGGSSNDGVIFSFDPSVSIYTKLKDFDKAKGANPNGSLLQANDGKLYGMTTNGGNSGDGVIFSFNPFSSQYAVLKSFDHTGGAYPYGAPVQASDGNLYGMTSNGGNGGGIIFSFDPSSSGYKSVKIFDNIDGGTTPFGSLIKGSDGKLYGMTINGGHTDYGVIFSFDPLSSTYKKLKDFDYSNGAYPAGSLMQASDGKLYGLTSQGGSDQGGVIFSFDPSSSTYTKLKDFDDDGGSHPYGNLVQANDGKLYGMTELGGSNGVGVIFSFDPTSSAYTKLVDFDKTNGARPFGSLIKANNGKVYGMATGGGSINGGVIFSYDPLSATYTKLHEFNSTDGADPYGNLVQASDGRLYGMTNQGGRGGFGVIFSFDPSSSTYTKLKDLDKMSGAHPSFSSAFIEINKTPTVSITTPDNNMTYLAPANIKLSAAASDTDGTISKVEFYNGTTLLHTEYTAPYGFKWRNIPVGNYTLTAKATDNGGLVATSAAIHISIVPNKPPTVSIIKPSNNQSFDAPGYIHFEAEAKDTDGRVTRVEFYNGSTLLRTEYEYPYTFVWKDVAQGSYTITAVATDNWGAQSTSAPVTIRIKPAKRTIVGSNPSIVNNLPDKTDVLNLELYPNPARNILDIYIKGCSLNTQTITVMSSTGVVLKTIKVKGLNNKVQLDVSSLASGVYTIKVLSGDKVKNKQFVKL